MFRNRTGVICCLVAFVAGLTVYAWSGRLAQTEPPQLHPQRSVVFFQWDGSAQHQGTIEQTAQYQSLVKSGLLAYGKKLLDQSLAPLMAQVEPSASREDLQRVEQAKSLFAGIYEHGFSVSITDGDDARLSPMATLVLHESADALVLVPDILASLDIHDEPDQKQVAGRDVNVLRNPRIPSIELCWWGEGDHLVVSIGLSCSERILAIADGDAPSVTKNRLWQKCREGDDFEVAALGWFDIESLRSRIGEMPVPIPDLERPVSVDELVTLLGLEQLRSVGGQFGYRGKSSVGRTFIDAPGPQRGLLSLMHQPLFGIEDLPPIPPNSQTFGAFSLDAKAAWDTLLQMTRAMVSLLPADATEDLNSGIAAIPQILGFDLREDLLAAIGEVHCIYSDPAGGPFGLGIGAAFSVRDPDKLRQTISGLAKRLNDFPPGRQMPVPIRLQRSQHQGRELLTIPAGIFTPTIAVGDKWLSVGLFPQTVKAFFLREDGDLPRWAPSDEHKAALAEMPQLFSAISIDDPRQGLQALYGFVPILNSAIHTVAPGFGPNIVNAADLPPQELVTQPLFPNVSMSVPDDNGVIYHSRQSLPLMLVPTVESGAAVPVLVALLLPAIQQAREAARRTESKNNLKNLGIAMHNHHDVYRYFPVGTEPDTKLKPEERLSFFVALLPFLDQAPLFDAMQKHRKEAWNSADNQRWSSIPIVTFHNPGLDVEAPAAIHYVGIAGVGKDAPELPVRHERAGIFGYDRKTRIADIRDGTSNTIMMTETTDTDLQWAEGSRTIRALTQEPYINGPDGIGGPFRGGCNVLFADGSVRFVSEDIDPETMRRLAAMGDGKPVGGF